MKKYIIAISCIGSGVGQSVVNSCRVSRLPIKTIGLGTNPFAYGAYDCDEYDYTPTIYAPNYIDELIKVCKKHKVDLLIPGLDNEALLFAQNAEKLKAAGINAMYADEELISICRDKERMSLELNKIVDVFVKSYNKTTLENDIKSGIVKFPFIAKPRGGYASNGIEIIRSKDDLYRINDDHIIQELALPSKDDPNYEFYISQINKNINPQVSEISIQVVVAPDGTTMGRMASYNKLNHGVPIEIVPYENEEVWKVVDKLMPIYLKMGLRGPLNIQGRMTDNGLKLFEMNPRFTGITGLRALMGFNEVEACIKRWLGIDDGKNSLMMNNDRFGVRQTADKSISLDCNNEIKKLSEHLNKKPLKPYKTILVTGACGYLGQTLMKQLEDKDQFRIWAFDLDKEKTQKLYPKLDCYDKKDLISGALSFGNIDCIVHLGFARPHCTQQEIADSLAFSGEIFTRAALNHVPRLINISSQSVYGLKQDPLWNEETPVAPETPYAQAKYATEVMLSNLYKVNNQFFSTNLRLAALTGGQGGLVLNDIVSKFVQKTLNKEDISIVGGNQIFERLDVRDAASAIVVLLNSLTEKWESYYNLGNNSTINIVDLAQKVIDRTQIVNSCTSKVIIEDSDCDLNFGMDSSLFLKQFNWAPQYSIEDTIDSLIKYLK